MQTIQQKTLKRDLKDLEQKKNDQIKTLDNEMKSLNEFKIKHDAEQRRKETWKRLLKSFELQRKPILRNILILQRTQTRPSMTWT